MVSNFVIHPLALTKYALGNQFCKVLADEMFPVPLTQFPNRVQETIFGMLKLVFKHLSS